MLLLSLITPLLHPLREQLSVLRAIASGGRIPGTKLILTSSTGSKRFGIIEHFMMALAGGWLLLRVCFCDLADEDRLQFARRKQITDQETETSTEDSTLEEDEYDWESNLEIERDMLLQSDDGGDGEGELIYWGCEKNDGNEPILKFSPSQLNILLRIDDESDEDEEYEENDDESECESEQETALRMGMGKELQGLPAEQPDQKKGDLQCTGGISWWIASTISERYKKYNNHDEKIVFAH